MIKVYHGITNCDSTGCVTKIGVVTEIGEFDDQDEAEGFAEGTAEKKIGHVERVEHDTRLWLLGPADNAGFRICVWTKEAV